jgi:hypothetical protein
MQTESKVMRRNEENKLQEKWANNGQAEMKKFAKNRKCHKINHRRNF